MEIIMPDLSKKFACVVADPPWLFGDKLPGASRGASNNYSCLSTDEICRLVLLRLLEKKESRGAVTSSFGAANSINQNVWST